MEKKNKGSRKASSDQERAKGFDVHSVAPDQDSRDSDMKKFNILESSSVQFIDPEKQKDKRTAIPNYLQQGRRKTGYVNASQPADINTSDCNSSCEASPLTSKLSASPSPSVVTVPQAQQLEPTTGMGQQIRQNVLQQVHIPPGQTPIQRLFKAAWSLPPELLRDDVAEMWSVTEDKDPGPVPGSREGAEKRCQTTGMSADTEFESTDTCRIKRRRPFAHHTLLEEDKETIERLLESVGWENLTKMAAAAEGGQATTYALLEEINESNRRLIETKAEIIDEDIIVPNVIPIAEGGVQRTVVKLTYTAVGSKNKQYSWTERLIIPDTYPHSSPTFMGMPPVVESEVCTDLSLRTRSKFSTSLSTLSQPISLKNMIKAWNDCAHGVMADYARRSGGGTAFTPWQTNPFL